MRGFVNNKPVTVLRDTGCTAIFVSEKLVQSSDLSVHEKEVTLADGSIRKCKEVQVKVDTPYISGVVDALVMSNPFADLIIGNLGNMHSEPEISESFQAVTKNMAKNSKSEEVLNQQSDERWKKDDYSLEEPQITTNSGKQFEDILCADELIVEQNNDISLLNAWKLAKGPVTLSRNSYFYEKEKILYRGFYDRGGVLVHQIVVPQKYRKSLMQVAHDIPLGGHMGNRKTRSRLLQNFFWPGIFKDVAEYCRSCPQCQRSVAKGKARKANLISIPPICEPFARVAIDIIGPLNRTKRGNRYILTLVDYSTKFPEAVPLKTTDTKTVAEALLGIFSRVGIPKVLLSDQGSNFTSALMNEMC